MAFVKKLHLPFILASLLNYFIGFSCLHYVLTTTQVIDGDILWHLQASILMPLGRGILLLWLAAQVDENPVWTRGFNWAVIAIGGYHILSLLWITSTQRYEVPMLLIPEMFVPAVLLWWQHVYEDRKATAADRSVSVQ
jgi:hypothetical protein